MSEDSAGKTPVVWLLLGEKAGDNNQVLALAEALGWPSREVHIRNKPWELLVGRKAGGTLAGVDLSQSSALEPPWPDLVISAGRRNEPVAQWIQRQQGGSARLVHIGRPWAPLACWDLLVTTPQYFLPEQANVLHNELPLHRISPRAVAAEAAALEPMLADLPRPWIVALLGGNSGQFVFTRDKAARMGQEVNALAESLGGSILFTDSRRTPENAGGAFRQQLTAPHFGYSWRDGGDNPYRGLLGLADRFVVTGESMSMLAEAAALGKPLAIFDLSDIDKPWWACAHNYRWKPLSHRFAMTFGPVRMRRDIGNIQQALVASGRAQWLGNAAGDTRPAALQDELDRSAAAVRLLFADRPQ